MHRVVKHHPYTRDLGRALRVQRQRPKGDRRCAAEKSVSNSRRSMPQLYYVTQVDAIALSG